MTGTLKKQKRRIIAQVIVGKSVIYTYPDGTTRPAVIVGSHDDGLADLGVFGEEYDFVPAVPTSPNGDPHTWCEKVVATAQPRRILN